MSANGVKPTMRGYIPAIAIMAIFLAVVPAVAAPPQQDGLQQRIDRLIRKLGNDEFIIRERAEAELGGLGLAALDALAAAQFDDDVEISVRARRLLQSIQVRWISDRDSKTVRRILNHYGELPSDQRLATVGELLRIPGAHGFVAIARIARYDPSAEVAKMAGLAVLSAPRPSQADTESFLMRMRYTLGDSRRESVAWIKTAMRLWDHPDETVREWSQLVKRESTTFVVHPELSGKRVLRSVLLAHVDVLLRHNLPEQARDTASRVLPLVEDDRAQLIETADWLLVHEWPDLMESLYTRFHDSFHQNTTLLFRLAEARRRAGDEAASNKAAGTALELVSANGPKAVWLLGMTLQNDGLFHWAEYAYRALTDQEKPDWKESASACISLAEMLHDLKRDSDAAAVLNRLVAAAKERPLKSVVERDTRQPISMLEARAAYFAACAHQRAGRPSEQRKELERALSLAPDDSDALIALYRQSRPDPDGFAAARKRVAASVTRYRKLIEVAKKRATEARSRLERTQAEIEIAEHCNRVAWLIANTEGDREWAIKCAEEAMRHYPDSAGIRDTLALCYYAGSRIDRAVKMQKMALEQDPHSPPLKERLELFLKAQARDKR